MAGTDFIKIDRAASDRAQARTLVVFIPGLAGDASQWEMIAPFVLAAGIDVGYVVRIPAGRNDRNQKVYSAVEAGSLLAREIETLRYSDVHIVAHSVGTFVALEALAVASPDLVASTLLVNGGLPTVGQFLKWPLATFASNPRVCASAIYLFLLVSLPAPRPVRNVLVRHRKVASMLLGRFVSRGALGSLEVRRLLVAGGGHLDILVALWRNRNEWTHFLEIAPLIRNHLQFLAGDKDVLAGVRDTQALAALLPNTCVTCLPGIGHAAPLEAPEVVVTAILGLVDRSFQCCTHR